MFEMETSSDLEPDRWACQCLPPPPLPSPPSYVSSPYQGLYLHLEPDTKYIQTEYFGRLNFKLQTYPGRFIGWKCLVCGFASFTLSGVMQHRICILCSYLQFSIRNCKQIPKLRVQSLGGGVDGHQMLTQICVIISNLENAECITKHRKNCECCHHHSVFKSHNVIVSFVVLNCLRCQVSGHKSLAFEGEIWNFPKTWKFSKNLKFFRKSEIKSGSVSESVTRSPIELSGDS